MHKRLVMCSQCSITYAGPSLKTNATSDVEVTECTNLKIKVLNTEGMEMYDYCKF